MDKKKVVLITGGATALAKQIALALSVNYKIIIHYNNSRDEALALLKEIGDNNCKIIQADFNKTDPVVFFERTLSLFNSIDIIINASSVFEKLRIEELNKEILERYNNIHSTFPLLFSIELYKYCLKSNKQGVVINISDAQLDIPGKGRIPYYLSKNALSYQSKLLASELAPTIRVNEIAPGFTLAKEWEKEYFKRLDNLLPFKITRVEEIVKAIEYFIDSEQVTGQYLKVDSGLSTLSTKLV